MDGCRIIIFSLLGPTLALFSASSSVHTQAFNGYTLLETRGSIFNSNHQAKLFYQAPALNERPRCQSGDPPGCKKLYLSQANVSEVVAPPLPDPPGRRAGSGGAKLKKDSYFKRVEVAEALTQMLPLSFSNSSFNVCRRDDEYGGGQREKSYIEQDYVSVGELSGSEGGRGEGNGGARFKNYPSSRNTRIALPSTQFISRSFSEKAFELSRRGGGYGGGQGGTNPSC